MKGIDTNILVRFLMADDEAQAKKVYAIFKQTERDKDELLVSLLVVLETIWVLDSVYKVSREEILAAMGDLLLMPVLVFERQSLLQEFTRMARENNYDLSDLLIAHSARALGCESVITFDRKVSRSVLFELVK
ncbi:MAG: PIN domain-containing protein [Verrucomicrobiales bacterium]|nr:PIN domain-containing protein [Verrucomicrobiales bacterium]